jgi:hypothetical protein
MPAAYSITSFYLSKYLSIFKFPKIPQKINADNHGLNGCLRSLF